MRFRLLSTLLALVLCSRSAGAFDRLDPAQLQELVRAQEACNELKFKRAESRINAVIAAEPRHPLPRLFMQAALLTRIQEADAAGADNTGLYKRFDAATDEAVKLSEKR